MAAALATGVTAKCSVLVLTTGRVAICKAEFIDVRHSSDSRSAVLNRGHSKEKIFSTKPDLIDVILQLGSNDVGLRAAYLARGEEAVAMIEADG